MDVEPHFTPGLGDSSYVVASAGEALVIDPQRDVDRLLGGALASGARVRYVLETHLHNDYVSGASEIRARTGAMLVGPVGAGYAFEHRGVDEGDELSLGALRFVALRTPGHTPEHVSYVVHEEGHDAPVAVFTGGSLIVGNAGRTDLLGAERTDELTRAQFRSLRRLSALPDETLVLPTHGAGSFCAAGKVQEERSSTIERERGTNPALGVGSEDAFVQQQLSGLMAFPRYYREMAPINRAGAPVVGHTPLPRPLSVEDVEGNLARGASLVDGRDGAAFAVEHAPGSINVPLDGSFASYVGWVLPFGAPPSSCRSRNRSRGTRPWMTPYSRPRRSCSGSDVSTSWGTSRAASRRGSRPDARPRGTTRCPRTTSRRSSAPVPQRTPCWMCGRRRSGMRDISKAARTCSSATSRSGSPRSRATAS
jgi:glyoxylase-like metal-dependent hydrolase (beta-lactamase superfamily II)